MSPFETVSDAVANWIDDLINSGEASEIIRALPQPESVEWDGSRVVLKFEEEVSCRHEPGEYYEVRWRVHVYIRSSISPPAIVQSVSWAQDRVYERVDLDVMNCTPRELLKAIRRVCRCVPADSPNQPDTPSLQDRYPNHPVFTDY